MTRSQSPDQTRGTATAPADLFDPSHYAGARKPLAQATGLPRWCYTDPAFFAREMERIFRRVWNFVCRVEEVATPGDYLVFDLAGESVIIVHGSDGCVRAFVNSCRHRGTRLLEGQGRCGKLISCPYHAWGFDTDGTLVATPGMEGVADFHKADWGLVPVRLEIWRGFVFINFDDGAAGLLDYLGNLPEQMASYDWDSLVCVRRKDYVLDCNWKFYVENSLEDYHTATVHKVSIGLQVTEPVPATPNWSGLWLQAPETIAILAPDRPVFPHMPGLEGHAADGTHFITVFPTFVIGAPQDCLWWQQVIPLSHDRMIISHGACFPRSTTERPDFAEVVKAYYRRWDTSIPEDNGISEEQQAGLGSSLALPGRLSLREEGVHRTANWVLDHVLDPPMTLRPAAE